MPSLIFLVFASAIALSPPSVRVRNRLFDLPDQFAGHVSPTALFVAGAAPRCKPEFTFLGEAVVPQANRREPNIAPVRPELSRRSPLCIVETCRESLPDVGFRDAEPLGPLCQPRPG